MGEVYAAHQITLGRSVALKVLSKRFGDDEVFRERFRREGMRQAALDHPNVVTVHAAGEYAAGLYLAMQLIEGSNVKQWIASGEATPSRTLHLLTQVAAALDAAHAAGLVHRDVKPQNLLVGFGDRAYVADFGIARAEQDVSLTATGQFIGTLDYIAPEVLRGETATASADVYSLAGVLYECLTGSVPFPRESEAAVLYAHTYGVPPAPSHLSPELPASIDRVIADGMSKDPAARPSAGALLADATEALHSTVQRSPRASLRAANATTRQDLLRTGPTVVAATPKPGSRSCHRSRQASVVVGVFLAFAACGWVAAGHGVFGGSASPSSATRAYTAAELAEAVTRVCRTNPSVVVGTGGRDAAYYAADATRLTSVLHGMKALRPRVSDGSAEMFRSTLALLAQQALAAGRLARDPTSSDPTYTTAGNRLGEMFQELGLTVNAEGRRCYG